MLIDIFNSQHTVVLSPIEHLPNVHDPVHHHRFQEDRNNHNLVSRDDKDLEHHMETDYMAFYTTNA